MWSRIKASPSPVSDEEWENAQKEIMKFNPARGLSRILLSAIQKGF